MSEILRTSGLFKSYRMGRTTLEVLRGIDLSVQEGEMVAIVGASGSGKSTLLHLLGCLDVPDRGEIFFQEKELTGTDETTKAHYRNTSVGFIFQFYHLLPELNALENVVLPEMMRKTTWEWAVEENALRRRGEELLGAVGLSGRATHIPGELSGGERQRVAIARALMNQPRVVLCDEPTGNLDSRTSQEVVDLLQELKSSLGQTFVIVTHETKLAERADRVLRIDEGRLASAGYHELAQ